MIAAGESAGSPKVYYIDGSKIAVAIGSIFSKVKGFEFEKLEFEMVDIRDSKGELVRLRIPRKDLYTVEKTITQSKEFGKVFHELKKYERLGQFVTKKILDGLIDSHPASISRALYVINVVRCHAHSEGVDRRILIIPDHPWFQFLEGYAKTIGVTLVFSQPGFGDLTKRISDTVRRFPRLFSALKMLEEARRSGLKPFAANRSQTSTSTKCYVEPKGSPYLDDDGRFSDFFWQTSSSFSRSRIVYPSQRRADEDRLRKYGIQPPTRRLHMPRALHFETPLIKKIGSKKEHVVIKKMMTEYQADFCYWNTLFQQQNIKIHLGWYKYNAKHMVIADAIRRTGGIAAIYQSAFSGDGTYECRLSTDIVFGYSGFGSEVERDNGSSISHFVVTGLLRNYNPERLLRRAAEIRETLKKAGVSKVVCVLDENSVDDKRWHTGHELQRENYSVILEELMRTPWLGVIFKPKAPGTLRSRLGPVNDLLVAAEKTGRCLILESSGATVASSTPALLAGLAADVVVHCHLSAGTAALECALKGIPTILIDREGASTSKLYELPSGKVRFANWPEALDSLMMHFRKSILDFGVWEKSFLLELDPFHDDKAATRMGSYLQCLIEGFDRGQDRREVLEEATNRYREVWGEDKVVQVGNCH